MIELGDMPGMSPIFRISRLGKSSLKRVIVILYSSKCDRKTGLPKICVGDVFYMRGGPLRKKHSMSSGMPIATGTPAA